MSEDMKEKIKKLKKEGWIDAWFAVEAMAVREEVVTSALEEHIGNLSKVKDVFIYEKKLKEIHEISGEGENKAYSQIIEIKLLIKNMFSFISVVILYGPSSIEIMSPKEIEIKIDEAQHIVNMLAGLIHQFAAAGAGGLIFTSKSK